MGVPPLLVWVLVLVALVPWLPVLARELVWTCRHYRWLTLLCVLLVTQSGYFLETVARLIEVHVQGRDPLTAPGIFGALNLQGVLLVWTIWPVLALTLLVTRFRRNRWLWAALGVTAWVAVDTHFGLVHAAASLSTLEIQLVYSLVEIALLNLAFALQLGRTSDAWLARAFPNVPARLMIDTTRRLEEIRLQPGERLERAADRVYIVTGGTGQLLRAGPGGHDILVHLLAPGQVIRDEGTLLAETTLELLALPAASL